MPWPRVRGNQMKTCLGAGQPERCCCRVTILVQQAARNCLPCTGGEHFRPGKTRAGAGKT
eukprot:363926-Chlamydomonas_euryale.AAC.14